MAFAINTKVKIKAKIADEEALARPFKGMVGVVEKLLVNSRVRVIFPSGSLKCDDSWITRA